MSGKRKGKRMTRGQRFDAVAELWADAVADVALATLWLSALAARRVASVLEWVATKADPATEPDDEDLDD